MLQVNRLLLLIPILLLIWLPVFSQNTGQEANQAGDEQTPPEKVEIQPSANDEQILSRIQNILLSTGWYQNINVEVTDGVVFLNGEAESEEHKTWAGNLARNTQDVTAVVNKIQIKPPDIWDYEPAINNVKNLWQNILRAVPTIIFALLVLLSFWLISILISKLVKKHLEKRNTNALLLQIISRSVAVFVFLIGIYIIFYIADLTRVALTVLGGTGLLGIILGIAFREITENFLASIFLSIQHPFQAGDLIQIAGHTGFIQRLTIRATLIMTLDGNHMQIPNSTVYKSNIINYTSNPNERIDFKIRIAYSNSIQEAQEAGYQILEDHPAVLKKPEPWVLVDELETGSIVIHFYYWLDGSKHNPLKVNSSVKRLVVNIFRQKGIQLADDVMTVQMAQSKSSDAKTAVSPKSSTGKKKKEIPKQEDVITKAEGDLQNNTEDLKQQSEKARIPEEGGDLLKAT